jgi:hypothetical protein
LLSSQRIRRIIAGFFVVLLGAGAGLTAWAALSSYRAVQEARELQAAAGQFRSVVATGDTAGARQAFDRAQAAAADLAARLARAPLSWARSAPFVGPTATSAATLARSADELLAASGAIARPLADGAAQDTAAAVALLDPVALTELTTAADRARREVAALDPGKALSPVRADLAAARATLLAGADALGQAAAVGQTLPRMLGVPAPTRWLVVLSQPAEARGSGGGFYGASLVVDVDQGRFTLRRAAANGPETGVVQDLSALPAEYRRLWGSDAQYLWGFNLSRHHPYTASVIHRALEPSAQYVVSLDPRAVAGLIAITGPVTAQGITLDAANAEAFFARDVYVRFPDPVAKDEVTLAFLSEVFDRLGTRLSLAPLIESLAPVVAGGHLQVWSPDPAAAAALSASQLGGAVPSLTSPWVSAAFNNAAGNKIDSFVRTALAYQAVGDCAAGAVEGSLTARLSIDPLPPGLPPYISGRNDEPGAPYGTTSMLVHLYGPSGARGIGSVTVDGVPVPAVQGTERGHPVWGVKVQLAPGVPVQVQARFEQPAFPGQQLQVAPQPMVQATEVSVVDRRSCAVG